MTPGQDNEALKTNGVTLLARTMAYHVIATYTKKYEERSRIFISLPYSHEKLNANNPNFYATKIWDSALKIFWKCQC